MYDPASNRRRTKTGLPQPTVDSPPPEDYHHRGLLLYLVTLQPGGDVCPVRTSVVFNL